MPESRDIDGMTRQDEKAGAKKSIGRLRTPKVFASGSVREQAAAWRSSNFSFSAFPHFRISEGRCLLLREGEALRLFAAGRPFFNVVSTLAVSHKAQ